MLAIKKWGERRYKPLVMVSHVVAICAESLYETLHRSREAWLLSTPEAGEFSLDDWLACYRKPLSLEGVLLQCLAAPEEIESLPTIRKDWPTLRRWMKTDGLAKLGRELSIARPAQREVDRCERLMNRIYRAHLKDMERLIEDSDEPPANYREWLSQPEFVFLFCVAAPCFLEYQVWPATLLRNALQGEFGALEKLVRLDPHVAHHQRLAAELFRLQRERPAQEKLLRAAMATGRTSNVSRDDVKFLLAGLLYKWSREIDRVLSGELQFELLPKFTPLEHQRELQRWINRERKRRQRKGRGCKLTAPDIRRLFNAVAQDTGKGLVDVDLMQDDEAFRKRVKRNADHWPDLRKWDIKGAA